MRTQAIVLTIILIAGCGDGLDGPYEVTRVIDGDTLELNDMRTIRLSGINTPETGECYYEEAKAKLKELALNQEIYLEKDRTDRDKYGRTLRYVHKGNMMINAVMVEQGYAAVFDKYKEDTKKYDQLKALEETAKKEKKGLWSCEEPQECLYVGSKNSNTYHKPDCKWAKRIKPENLVCYTSEEEIISMKPCGTCIS